MNLKNIFFIGMVLLILTMGFVSASEQSIIDDLSVSLDDSNNQEPLAIDENFDVSNEKKDSLSAGENQDPLNDDKNENILAVSYTEDTASMVNGDFVGKTVILANANSNEETSDDPVSNDENSVKSKTNINIGNTRLLTNGFLRIYLKSDNPSAVSKKLLHITINNNTFDKTTNSEGIVVFKPLAGLGTLSISVRFDGDSNAAASSAKKSVKGIEGNPKSPFYYKIPLRGGAPDIDLMPGNYVLADKTATYTLTKNQYLAVIKRDSYCLFLNNKLSKYTVFKTKKEPGLFHIIPRKKWNVIERAINTKVVKKNKKGYWPSQITVNLKGKSYTYSEVRDVQDLTYSCGPTSSSMCTQVLRNYVCEKYLVKLSGAKKGRGSSPTGLSKALRKNHYKCTEYYKSAFYKALKELKKGGCALVFHTWGHYVAILDISKNGKKVLVANTRGGYNSNSDKLPTKWLTAKFVKSRFANDTPGLIVRLNYSLSKKTKNKINNFYSSLGTKWTRQNTSERIPQI